jgi:isoleucyl-tRNA synthetase
MEKWDVAEKLRDDVNAVLETARAEKKIGKALEAHVSLHAEDDETAQALMSTFGVSLAEVFIVSDCNITGAPVAEDSTVGKGTNFPGLTVEVSQAKGEKCQRCWMQSTHVGENPDHPALCPRCASVVSKLPQF